jgi:hypothetical protein
MPIPAEEFRGVIVDRPVMFFGQEIPRGILQKIWRRCPHLHRSPRPRNPVERTFEAVVEVENKGGLLRPGMTVRGKIHAGTHPWGKLVLQSILDLWSLDYRWFF